MSEWELQSFARPPYRAERVGYGWMVLDSLGRNVAHRPGGAVAFRDEGEAEAVAARFNEHAGTA